MSYLSIGLKRKPDHVELSSNFFPILGLSYSDFRGPGMWGNRLSVSLWKVGVPGLARSLCWELLRMWTQQIQSWQTGFFSEKVFKFHPHPICFWGSIRRTAMPPFIILSVVYDPITFLDRPMLQLHQGLPEQPHGTCLLLRHSRLCAGPRDLLKWFCVSSKGYRKLECGRKVVPFFFPETLLLNLFCPAATGHSKISLPKSKWEGGTDLCSGVITNSTE